MADLEVQPKKRTPWWLWLLLLLIIAAIVYYFMKGRNQLASVNTGSDSTSTTQTTTTTVNQSRWDSVNFNGPKANYSEVTDTAVKVSEAGNYAVYSLGENVLFTSGQSTVESNADAHLKQVAASLNQRYKNAMIGVFGRTDSTGTAGTNKQLGEQRAQAVKDWLVRNANIPEANISVHSLGETQPVASNSTASGRQLNRSVEIVAMRDSSSKAQ